MEILRAEIIAKVSDFIKGMRDAARESESTANRIDRATDKISRAVTSNISGVFSTAAIVGFGKAVLDATAEYEKFSAVLGNTLGSSTLANLKLKEIQQFAAETPFGVNELTGAFVKLANSGFKPTGDQMRKLGDLASSTGKSFDQLAEAIIDAQTGEFERLKEFGVRAKDAGDSVIFTYKGVQTQVEKTSGSIREYITNLGAAEGTSGSMAKISETLGGKISNLGDSWDQMLISVGSNTSGVFSSAINIINQAISKITQYNNEINTVSKYKLGSNTKEFFSQLNRAVNPFASKGATDIEKQVANINLTEKAVNDLVSKTISGAKNVNDFGKALADLKQKSDLTRGLTSVSKFVETASKMNLSGNVNELRNSLPSLFIDTKAEANSIQKVYQNAINAVLDARRNFIKESKISDANFGIGKGDKDKIGDIYKKLESELKSNPLDFGATKIEIGVANIQSYQTAIKGLIDNGYKPASTAIKDLIEKQRKLSDSFRGNDLVAPTIDLKNLLGIKDAEFTIKPKLKIEPIVVGLNEFQKRVQQFNDQATSLVSSAVSNGFSALGTSIGESLATGGDIIAALGSSVLSIIGNIATELGKAAISIGIGMLAIKAAFKNPFTAIAAGIALVTLGSFISSKVSQIPSGNSEQKSSAPQFKAFANGGIVHGPTLGLMGEYAGASSNPEVIAPLNKLKDLLPQTTGGIAIPDVKVRGEDIFISFKRAEKRLGGLG